LAKTLAVVGGDEPSAEETDSHMWRR
jgi:hypothetical protein